MKKTVYIDPTFYYINKTYLFDKKKFLNKTQPKLLCRNTILLPICLGKTFKVYNGKNFLKVHVSEDIIGHKLGEFSPSRSRYFFKKGKIKKKTKK